MDEDRIHTIGLDYHRNNVYLNLHNFIQNVVYISEMKKIILISWFNQIIR